MAVHAIEQVQLAMPPGGGKARDFSSQFWVSLRFQSRPDWLNAAAHGFSRGRCSCTSEPRQVYPAFLDNYLDDLLQPVQSAGYETNTTQPLLGGYNRAHFFDPFGNRIELMEKR
jgi:hypothetical protein